MRNIPSRTLIICISLLSILQVGCRGLEKSEKERQRAKNVMEEPVFRLASEQFAVDTALEPQLRDHYPWEERFIGNFPRVTKEFFRCQGSYHNPSVERGKSEIKDCGGRDAHSLPLNEGEEYVPPIFIHLLNHVQLRLQKPVVVTCGHRCPTHNTYADINGEAKASKHMIGAEIDFYVEGAESDPLQVVAALMDYYRNDPLFADNKAYTHFLESKENPLTWQNREVIIRVHPSREGHDLDNQHGNPYVTVELRIDRASGRTIHFNVTDAHQNLFQL